MKNDILTITGCLQSLFKDDVYMNRITRPVEGMHLGLFACFAASNLPWRNICRKGRESQLPSQKSNNFTWKLKNGVPKIREKTDPYLVLSYSNQGPSHDLHILTPSLPCASAAKERPQDQECQRSPSKKSERQGRSSHLKIGINRIYLFK